MSHRLLSALLAGCLSLGPVSSLFAASEEPVKQVKSCATGTLCERLGGPDALDTIAASLIDLSVADPRTREHWIRSDLKRVKSKLGDYFCTMTGGSCVFDDDDIRTIHAGQHIRAGEFYALVEDLRIVLDQRGVADREKNELLAVLAPRKREVVEQ